MASQDSKWVQDGNTIDYTPGADVVGGSVEVVGTHPLPAKSDIESGVLGALEARGTFDFAKKTGAVSFSAGDTAYWDANGTSMADTAASTTLSGCVTDTAADGELLGMVTADAAVGDTWVRVRLTNVELTSTIAGSISVTDVTCSDTVLTIGGLPAATAGDGGTIVSAGGLAHTNGAGGAVSYTGGAGSAAGTGAGGAASLVGGESGGGATGAGGAVAVTGGEAASTAGAGGAVAMTGGLGTTTADGGAITITGGAAGATGDGGAVSITSGADTGGTVGAVAIDTGVAGGTGAGITIGAANATTISMGLSTVTTGITASAPINFIADSGAADAAVLTLVPAIDGYAAGQMICFTPTADNTAACTVNVNGLGAKSILLSDGANPAAGDLDASGALAMIVYNGTAFVLINPATNAP